MGFTTHSFITLCMLFVSCFQVLDLIRRFFSSKHFTKLQRFLQTTSAVCLMVYVLYESTLLRRLYAHGVSSANEQLILLEFASLLAAAENILRCISILAIIVLLHFLRPLEEKGGLKDGCVQATVIVCAIARFIPVFMIWSKLVDDTALKVALMEIMLTSEAVILFVIYLNLLQRAKKVDRCLSEAFGTDQLFVECTVGRIIAVCRGFVACFCIEALLRMGIFALAFSPQTRTLGVLGDICGLMRIVFRIGIFMCAFETIFAEDEAEECMACKTDEGRREKKTNIRFFNFDLSGQSTTENEQNEIFVEVDEIK